MLQSEFVCSRFSGASVRACSAPCNAPVQASLQCPGPAFGGPGPGDFCFKPLVILVTLILQCPTYAYLQQLLVLQGLSCGVLRIVI